MTPVYDLVVIGSGTAASVAISRCSAAGWTVASIDHRPFGGTCALRGCDPKKVLVGAAEGVDLARRLRGKGVREQQLGIDWAELMRFKRGFTDPVPVNKEKSFADMGVHTYHGVARFTGPMTVRVGRDIIEARHFLIAAGAEPAKLGIKGEEHLTTSDGFLELETMPERIVLVGGGYIAFEFAHIARRAGAEVTVLEQAPSVLTAFDQDLVGWLVERSRRLGIDIRSSTAVEAIERDARAFTIHGSTDGERRDIHADLVVHAAGRVPALEALDLDAAGVEHEHDRIKLNEFLQSTSNARIYAAGDAAQAGPPLTPVSSRDGKVAAANMLEGNHATADYNGTPSVVFTIPPLASVGLGQDEAKDAGLSFRVNCRETSNWYTNRRVNEEAAGFKVLVEDGTERILGAHVLGPHADELINVFAVAIRFGLSATRLEDVSFAYPTSASNIAEML